MQVVCRGASCFSCNADRRSCFYVVAGMYQMSCVVRIHGFQSVVMPNHDDITISPAPACHSDDSVEGCGDGVTTVDFQVNPLVHPSVSPSEMGKNPGSGEWEIKGAFLDVF